MAVLSSPRWSMAEDADHYSERWISIRPSWIITYSSGPTRLLEPKFRVTTLQDMVCFRSFTPPIRVPRPHGLSGILRDEWPEIHEIAVKLTREELLTPIEKEWVREASEAAGWDSKDLEEDLRHADDDPSGRVERYRELFEEYLREARKFKDKGDTRQAAEKIWGAVTVLIKLYAALKGVPVVQWSRGRMDRFVTNNVEAEHKRVFRDLLDKGQRMHEHFYEGNLDPKSFEERWWELLERLEEARRVVLSCKGPRKGEG